MAKSEPGIRFVNRTGKIVRLSGRRGNRIALANGEWVTHPYYERFARLASEPQRDNRMLTKEYEDGTPVGLDELPSDTGDVIQAPAQVKPTPVVPGGNPPPPGGCETGCESGCEFPVETSPTSTDRINATMNQPPQPQTPMESLQSVEGKLEPGMAPPIPSTAPQSDSVLTPEPIPDSAPPIPEGVGMDEPFELATVDDIKDKYDLTDEELLEVTDHYVKAVLDGEDSYISRFDPDWVTSHLSQMRRHITLKQKGDEEESTDD